MRRSFYKIVTVLLVFLPQISKADVTLNAIFSNHMVIQRETEVPIWGWADVGEQVEVVGSWGNKATVVTGKDGKWRVDLQTPKAGGPYKITISGKNRIEINDVLSGEVWLCTGQSNMDFELSKFVNDAREPQYQPLVEYIRNEVATANDDHIRHIEVLQTTSLFKPQTNFEGHWISANPEQIGKITATGYFFAKELRKALDVPIGLVECSWGGTRIQPWISEKVYLADKNLKAYYEATMSELKSAIKKADADNFRDTLYEVKYEKWIAKGRPGSKPNSKHPLNNMQNPTTLYNAMVNPIIPYKVKGVLWYQGESNSHFFEERYEAYFTTLIKSWREAWGQGTMPFYWMQLAAYKVPDRRSDLGWAMVNDHLRRTLKLPKTGMAVLYDLGEAKDVHPHNKMDASKRLALWALKNDYGMNVPVISGPLYNSYEVIGDKIQIEFKEVGSGLMVGEKQLLNATVAVDKPLKWFEIKGVDGVWKPAEAHIFSKNKIEVSHPEITDPTHVRYAWSSYPEGANLYNKEGLPAAVFTTE